MLSRLARMPSRGPHRALLAAVLVIGAFLVFAGCGEESTNPELLPEKLANSMLDDLEEAQVALDEGDCERMERRLDKVFERIAALGSPPTDRQLKLNLREGINTLQEEASAECEETSEPEEEPTEPVPAPEPEPTTPVEPEDSEDEEEPTPEQPNPDQPEEPEPEPDVEPGPPEPGPAPNPEPAPPANPPPTSPGGSGGVGPGSAVGGS